MIGKDVRKVFETVVPDEAMETLIETPGFQERERKLDAPLFVRTSVISAPISLNRPASSGRP